MCDNNGKGCCKAYLKSSTMTALEESGLVFSRAKDSRIQLYPEHEAGLSLKAMSTDNSLFLWNPFSSWKWLAMVEGLLPNSKHEPKWEDIIHGFHWVFRVHSKSLGWTSIPLLSTHWTVTFLDLQGCLFHPCAQMLSHVQLFFDLMDCNPPVSSVSGIFQARILEWGAISSSRESSQPRDWTCISMTPALAGGFFTTEPSGNPLFHLYWPTISNRFPVTDTWIFLDFFFFYFKCCRIIFSLTMSSLTLSQDKLTALIIGAAQFWNLLNRMSVLTVSIPLEKQSSWD